MNMRDRSNTDDMTIGLFSSEYVSVLIVISLAVWLHAADSMLVATMLPSMIVDIGGANLVGWNITLYELGTLITGAASGLAALRYGIRSPMVVAALIFALGCAVSAIAPNMWVVLIGRFMQGVGGGGLMALSYVATGTLFPPHLIPRAMAVTSTVWGVSAFLGPLIGGLFVQHSSWRFGFLFFGAVAVVVAISIWLSVPRHKRVEPVKAIRVKSLYNLLLLAIGVLCISFASVEISLLRTTLLVSFGIIFLIIFCYIDSNAGQERMLPSDLFNPRSSTSWSFAMVFCIAISTIAMTSYGTVLLVSIHQISALVAGYVVACTSIGWTLAAIFVARIEKQWDFHLIAIGVTLATISILGLLITLPTGPIWLIALFAAAEGCGFGMAWSFIMRQTASQAAPGEVERATGALPTIHRFGYAIGAACLGIIANSSGFSVASTPEEFRITAQSLFLFCVPVAILGMIAMHKFITMARRNQ